MRRIRSELYEAQAQLERANAQIASLARDNHARDAIINGYRNEAREESMRKHNMKMQSTMTSAEARGTSDEAMGSSGKTEAWMPMNRLPHRMSVGDMMANIFRLWDSLSIPLVHRSLFYGSPSVVQGVMYGDTNNIERELRRLEWMYARCETDKAFRSRLVSGLIRERQWLVRQVARMRKEDRMRLYSNWGVRAYDPADPTRRLHRKQEIVRMLWSTKGRERQSAGLVVHLLIDVADVMPLLNPKIAMLESFYAIAS